MVTACRQELLEEMDGNLKLLVETNQFIVWYEDIVFAIAHSFNPNDVLFYTHKDIVLTKNKLFTFFVRINFRNSFDLICQAR